MTNVEENRIIASSLCYRYPEAEKNAVDEVSMRVKKGEFLAILGHNGSGKSTLAKLFNALYVPGSGTVWVCGMDTKDDDLVFDIRQHAGMVFQNPDNQRRLWRRTWLSALKTTACRPRKSACASTTRFGLSA